MSTPLSRLGLGALLLFVACAAGGCDESTEARTPARAKRAAASAAEIAGTWTLDADTFLDENWSVFLGAAQPSLDRLRQELERIDGLPASEREAARARMEAGIEALPPYQQPLLRAALQGPDALKAAAKELVARQFTADSVRFEFLADGTCTLELALPGKPPSIAQGRWTLAGTTATVRLETVDGRPAKGKDLQSTVLTLRDGRLRFQPVAKGPTLVVKRV